MFQHRASPRGTILSPSLPLSLPLFLCSHTSLTLSRQCIAFSHSQKSCSVTGTTADTESNRQLLERSTTDSNLFAYRITLVLHGILSLSLSEQVFSLLFPELGIERSK